MNLSKSYATKLNMLSRLSRGQMPQVYLTLLLMIIAIPALAAGTCLPLEVSGSFGESSGDGMLAGLSAAIENGELAWVFFLVLFAGLLTALSPCVYPLIPITLGILGTRKYHDHWHGFLISATYVLGIVVLYTALGTIFASLGWVMGGVFQSPWVMGGIIILFILLALEMFGAYEIRLPASLSNQLTHVGGRGYKGAFLMGLVAGLIAAPCTGPVSAFILTMIARNQNVALGSALMAIYALGLGLPFLLLGSFSAAISKMPKSGPWMETVKSFFGLAMFVGALYYLQLMWPEFKEILAPLGVWDPYLALILIIVGLLLGALHFTFKDSHPFEKFKKGLGILSLTYGILISLSCLEVIEQKANHPTSNLIWNVINETDGEAVAKFDAILASRKPCQRVLVDFYADWCIACKELDHNTWPDPAVQTILKDFLLIKVDATHDTPSLNKLQQHFGVVGLPLIRFYGSDGKLDEKLIIPGFIGPEIFLGELGNLL